MATTGSILEALADALPLGLELLFYHTSTPPTPSSALFSTPPGQIEETTFCESHFLAASLPGKGVLDRELLVFAIEVLVFTSRNLTTIFVSKADSTGYLHLLDTQPGSPSIIKIVCTTVLSYLVKQRLHGPRVLLSLFARSQNQYLFPGSIENPGKHVLDDRQLIKWWCQTLDPVLQGYGPASATPRLNSGSNASSEAFIIVPGCDRFDTRAFYPPSTKSEPVLRWSNSYPRDLIVPDGSASPRCLIPRFPDDPKARFLDDLDSEISDSDSSKIGNWRSVKSLDQFWEMMSYRQECSAGRLVGFIWVVFIPPQAGEKSHVCPRDGRPDDTEQSVQTAEQLPTPNQSQINSLDLVLPPLPVGDDRLEPIRAASPPPSSPLLTTTNGPDGPPSKKSNERPQNSSQEKPDTQLNADNQESDNLCYDDARSTLVRWPSASRGHLILSEQSYQHLMNHLLQSDFSDQDLAAQSTSSWINKASELARISNWGQSLTGRKPVVPVTQSSGSERKTNVNVLTVTRKKRKATDGGDGGETGMAAAAMDEAIPVPEVATLSMDMIRKKRKATS